MAEMFQPPAEHGAQGPILGHRNGCWTPACSLKGQWYLAPLGSVLCQHSQPPCWVPCPLRKEIPIPHSSGHKDESEKWNAVTKTRWPYNICCLHSGFFISPSYSLFFLYIWDIQINTTQSKEGPAQGSCQTRCGIHWHPVKADPHLS